jgi:ferritin-like metal-binding protein YciE
MAAYGAVREIAKVLGKRSTRRCSKKTLAEEKQTDEKLAQLAKEINAQAIEEGSEEQPVTAKPGRKSSNRAA